MTKIYQQAFSEVNEILSYLSKENYNKIPKEVIDAIEENKDDDYVFFIDTTIPFEEQEILEESKAILFNIYKDYLSNEEEKCKNLFKLLHSMIIQRKKILVNKNVGNYDSCLLFFDGFKIWYCRYQKAPKPML